jgi:uncharacterized protein YcbK (DUF882 family)
MLLHRRRAGFGAVALVVFGLSSSFALTPRARADRQHTVKSGQSLAQIAKQYGVSIAALAKANKLGPDASLQIGQRLTLPGGVPAKSSKGDAKPAKSDAKPAKSDAKPAKSDAKPAKSDANASKLAKPDKPVKADPKWGTSKRPGTVSFYRIWSRETMRVKLVDDKRIPRTAAQRAMREIMRPRESRKRKLPNARLLRLLADVSDHFGGRQLQIVSGYRLPGGLTRDTSRHVAGEAMDFRIPGVTLTELRDYCQHFDAVGVGYYPRTQFVHLDVRRQNARWTDWSLPGQAPVLQKPDDVDDLGHPIEAEPIMAASDRDLQEAPPAPDDGLPPLEDVPAPHAFGKVSALPPAAPKPASTPKSRVIH